MSAGDINMFTCKQISLPILTTLLVVSIYSSGTGADIYRWVDEDGRVNFSERKPMGQQAELVNVKVAKPSPQAIDNLFFLHYYPNTLTQGAFFLNRNIFPGASFNKLSIYSNLSRLTAWQGPCRI